MWVFITATQGRAEQSQLHPHPHHVRFSSSVSSSRRAVFFAVSCWRLPPAPTAMCAAGDECVAARAGPNPTYTSWTCQWRRPSAWRGSPPAWTWRPTAWCACGARSRCPSLGEGERRARLLGKTPVAYPSRPFPADVCVFFLAGHVVCRIVS